MTTAHHRTPAGHDPTRCVPCLHQRIEGLVWALGQAHARVRVLEQREAERDGVSQG